MSTPRAAVLRTDLRAIYVDGIVYSLMVGLGEIYVPAFALRLGKSDATAALVATLPMLAGALLQLVSLRVVRQLGSLRRWVVVCVALQAACFVPLAVCAWTGSMPTLLLFLAVALYWTVGLASGPAWSSWVETLVPRALRINYFAVRTRMLHVAALVGLAAGGWILQSTRGWEPPTRGFVILFACAALARTASAVCLASQSEHGGAHVGTRVVGLREFLARLAHGRDGKLLAYMLALQLAAQVAQPFFTPFMLSRLELDYAHYMGLVSAAFLSKSISLEFHRRFAQRFGVRALLWVGALGLVPCSLPWMLTDSWGWLFATQILTGAAWAAWELSTFLLIFDAVEAEERTSVLTSYSACNALAFVLGSLGGTALLAGAGGGTKAFYLLFGVSALLRLCALPLLARVPRLEPRRGPIGSGVEALRPSAGSIDEPLLPQLERSEPARAGPEKPSGVKS